MPTIRRLKKAKRVAHSGGRILNAISVTGRKKAVAWAVWALGNDQSDGIATISSAVEGRGLRNISFSAWTETIVINKLQLIKITCPFLPAQSSRIQSRADSGKRIYSDPNQVMVTKNKSINEPIKVGYS